MPIVCVPPRELAAVPQAISVLPGNQHDTKSAGAAVGRFLSWLLGGCAVPDCRDMGYRVRRLTVVVRPSMPPP